MQKAAQKLLGASGYHPGVSSVTESRRSINYESLRAQKMYCINSLNHLQILNDQPIISFVSTLTSETTRNMHKLGTLKREL